MEQQKFVYTPGLGRSYAGAQRMNRLSIQSADAKALINPEARRLAKRIIEADERIGAKSAELQGQINNEGNLEKILKDQLREYPSKDAYTQHLRQEKLAKQSKKVKQLIADRDELIDTEIGTYEYEKIVRGLLECYDKDTKQRSKDLRRYLEAVKEILEIQFAQATAYEQLLIIINTHLNSGEKLVCLDSFPYDHKSLGQLTVTNGISWIINTLDVLDDLPDSFDKL